MDKAKKKKILKHIMLFFLTLIIFFVFLEFAFRKYTDKKMISFIEMRKYSEILLQKSKIPGIPHEHIANKKAKLMGVELAINSDGFRGKNISNKNATKIFMLGSSITMGWGVSHEKICSTQLQGFLNNDSDKKYEVINGGVANYNTIREEKFLQDKINNVKPNIVILHYFVNDAEILQNTKPNIFSQNSYLISYLTLKIEEALFYNKSKFKTIGDYYASLYEENSIGWKLTRDAILNIKKITAKNNAKLIVAIQPDLRDLSIKNNEHYLKVITKFLEQNNIKYKNLFPAYNKNFAKNPHAIWISKDDAHPNKEGHRIIAEELFLFLQKQK